jgi:hypothetical protein
VNAQGVLVMHTSLGERLDAQIDGRGTVTGTFTGSPCSYHMVWQKEGKWTLSAEPALDKGDGDIEAAVAGEILVPSLGREPALFVGSPISHRCAGLD